MTDNLTWIKSSYSGAQDHSNCVEVAALGAGGRAVRDSKNPAGGMLSFSAGAFAAFVRATRDGDFD